MRRRGSGAHVSGCGVSAQHGPEPGLVGGRTQRQPGGVDAIELFAQSVGESPFLHLQVVHEAAQFPQVNGLRGVGHTARNARRSVRKASATAWASRRSSFAPAAVNRSRNRSSCLGLRAKTANRCWINVSTSTPRGVSSPMATASGGTPVPLADPLQGLMDGDGGMGHGPRPRDLPARVEQTELVFLHAPIDSQIPRESSPTHALLFCPAVPCTASPLYGHSRRNFPRDVRHGPPRRGASLSEALRGAGRRWHSRQGGRARITRYQLRSRTPVEAAGAVEDAEHAEKLQGFMIVRHTKKTPRALRSLRCKALTAKAVGAWMTSKQRPLHAFVIE